MHQISLFADIFGEDGPQSHMLARSMDMIAKAGSGIVVLINRSEPDRFSRIIEARGSGPGASSRAMEDLRDYGVGAQILSDLGVRDMILLTNNRHNLIALDGYDLQVVEERPILI
jgi:3,4-dihydroxy 2-butanone 4-phosphate synthase/GTP cyclohydrolase II